VQALYLMQSSSGAGLKARLGEFAWMVKNLVRPLGWHRAGLPCQLMGTGMAFPWPLIREAPLASPHLVEDLQLGVDCAAAGAPPRFCPEARVTSRFPADPQALATQRARWEHGHLGVIAAQVPTLLWRALARGRPVLAAMALDLAVPPLASLVLMLGAWWLVSALALAMGFGAGPLVIASTALALLAAAVLMAWARHGRSIVSLAELLGAPLYALAKLPLYLGWLRGRSLPWVRTRRDDETS
jgi:cellulose synthase/poly-beta-1,6-N-acetylglucosamine synthase-like glycosyltransferase